MFNCFWWVFLCCCRFASQPVMTNQEPHSWSSPGRWSHTQSHLHACEEVLLQHLSLCINLYMTRVNRNWTCVCFFRVTVRCPSCSQPSMKSISSGETCRSQCHCVTTCCSVVVLHYLFILLCADVRWGNHLFSKRLPARNSFCGITRM